MNIIYSYIGEEWVEATGWALLHSLWQVTIILILLLGIFFLFRKLSAHVRYLIAYSSLIACLLWAGGTFYKAWNYAHEKQVLKEKLLENPAEITNLLVSGLNSKTLQAENTSFADLNTVRLRAFFQRHFPEVFILWFLGIFIFLLRMSGGMFYLSRLRSRQTIPIDSAWNNIISKYAEKLGVKQKLQALQSSLVKVPMVIGHVKPVILFPVSLFTGLGQQEIEAIIAHELAHIKRYDYLLNIIQSVIEILFFFHPAIWFISKIIRDEREHSCDDLAVMATGDKINYMKALASTQQIILNTNSMYAVAFGKKHSLIFQRINRIKNLRTMKNNVTEGFIAATFIFISLILLSFTIDNQNLKGEDFYSNNNEANSKASVNTFSKNNSRALRDSVRVKIVQIAGDNDSLPKDMQKVVEIALTDDGENLSWVIVNSIDSAMHCFEVQKAVTLAMYKADSALQHIKIDVEVDNAMAEAREEMNKALNETEFCKQELEGSKEALKQVKIIMDSLKIDTIINQSLNEVQVYLNSDEFKKVIEISVKATEDAISKIDIDKIINEATTFEYNFTPDDNDSVISKKIIINRELDNEQDGNEKQMEEELKELEGN